MSGSAQNDGMDDRNSDVSRSDLSDRRDRLNHKLEQQNEAQSAKTPALKSERSSYGQAMKLSSEFISGIVVGVGIGWFVDQWFGTTPFGLIVFLLIGFAAGVLNVLRAAGEVAQPEARVERLKDGKDGPK